MTTEYLARLLDDAACHAQPIEQLSHAYPFSVAEAYDIQKASLERRYGRGERLIGLKMGFTSKAKMEQMGVFDLIWGRLTDAMLFDNGAQIPFDRFIHPRAEPEICFKLKKTIDQPVPLSDIKNYVAAIAGAIEIIDSRYRNFKFSLEDVIADNCSSAGAVVGSWHDPDTPVGDLKITLCANGKVCAEGSSAAILGNPWESLVEATRLASQYGEVIEAGSIILAGAATPAVYVEKGQKVEAQIEKLGRVSFQMI